MTFQFDGKDACPAKQIPEPTLLIICCEVMVIAEFDERVFAELCPAYGVAPNECFHPCDGRHRDEGLERRSRKESWTVR
jgi:hypothetical protein